jgi:hypothetical protein
MVTLSATRTRPTIQDDLYKKLSLMEKQHAALEAESTWADPARKVALESHAENLRSEITKLNADIANYRKASTDPVVSERAWREKLPEIDFRAPANAFKVILEKMPRDGGSALLLMQDGMASAASLCVERLVAELRRPLSLPLRPRFAGPSPSPRELMHKLSDYLNLPPNSNADALATSIVRALVDSLAPGCIVWLDLECDSAANAPEFLGWFLETFWRQLVQELAERANTARFARVFGVIRYNVPIGAGRLKADWLCSADTFHALRFVEIPLEPAWKTSDISDWLIQYTAVPRCAGIDIDAVAQSIYDMCREGVPEMVLRQLDRLVMRALTQAGCLMESGPTSYPIRFGNDER